MPRLLFPVFFLLASMMTASAIPIKFLPWDEQIAARKIAYRNGDELVEIRDLHPDKRTKTYVWQGGEAVPALIATDRKTPEGKVAAEPIKLPAGIVAPLVLLLPDNGKPCGFRCYIIEDSSGSFGWGDLRFINATGKNLLVRQDKLIKALPGGWKPVDIDPGGDSRNIGIQLAARDDLKSILYSAVWEYDPNIRKLVFVVPGTNASTGALDIKVIPEDRRAASQSQKPVAP